MGFHGASNEEADGTRPSVSTGDQGGASRFFYCSKASKADRGPDNDHPTVKPLDLMAWLIRLITPPEATVLDPFAGSGTTGLAAIREDRRAILIEQNPHYFEIARRRLERAAAEPRQLTLDF